METHISCLFPELLAMIFGYLDVRDKGRAAQVCTAWRDAAYHKSVWRGVEAKLHLRRANPSLFPSLQARGIRRVQILSLRRSLSYVIQGMANIESLNLSGCYNLTDNGLGHAFVQEIGSLRALNLSLCKQITDSSLGRIAQYLKGLEVLELGGCSNITNTGLLLIAWGLQRLKSLNLRSCRHLSDVGIGHLAGMTRSAAEGCLGLEQLTLQDCQKLTDLSLKHISRGLTGLRLLNLSFCGGISDAGLLHLSHMGSLRSLNLRSCDNISDTGIMHLAMGSLRLSGLDVSFCDKVGDQSLAYIAQGLDGLKSLSLCSCHISDDGINRMVRQMHGLRTLNIGQCVRITDKGLELIAEHLSQLTGIDLYGCTRITKRGLERITQLPCLKVLNLGLWQMTDSEKVRILLVLSQPATESRPFCSPGRIRYRLHLGFMEGDLPEATTLFIHGACELCVRPAGGSVVCELLPSSEHPTENFRAGEPQASRKMIRNFPVSSGSGIPVLGTPFREQEERRCWLFSTTNQKKTEVYCL
ncbi:F-box/LRR-repeat protein 14 isoform X1 [Bos javanicus]|uniref:F-box/LRR-repeat protein 14 isoform X1 n=2 Tax=Bos javanicus TaxID=9906 RepID=UPI002AA85403|nr:F-box/LRR-repeat protein 14 isoform X1 [Bos javanicus]